VSQIAALYETVLLARTEWNPAYSTDSTFGSKALCNTMAKPRCSEAYGYLVPVTVALRKQAVVSTLPRIPVSAQ